MSLLVATVGVTIAGGLALGFGPTASLQVAQLRYEGGNWNPRPNALRRLAWEVMKRTSIEMGLEPVPVGMNDEEMFKHPLLYVAGSGRFPPFPEPVVKRLRRYLVNGGLLLFDSADESGGFEESVRRETKRLFPDRELRPVPSDHVLFKSFYLVNRAGGRVIKRPYLEGLDIDTRTAVLFSHNDLGAAWSRDGFGNWEYQVIPGGESQREMTFRLGINLVMYALCLDYKEDQVHVPFILKRRR